MTLQEHYNSIKNGGGNKDQFLKQARNLFPEYFNQYTDFNTATNVLKSKQIISEAAGGVVSKGFDIFDWKKIINEYGEDSGGQDMTWKGMYKDQSKKLKGTNQDFIDKGKEDYYDDIPFEACPYESGYNKYYRTDLAKLWQLGWKKAKAEDEGIEFIEDEPNNKDYDDQTRDYDEVNLTESIKATEKETSKEVLDNQKNAYNNSDTKNADNVNFNEIMKGFYAEMRDEKNAGKTGDEIKAMVVKNLAKDPLHYTKDGMFGVKGVGYTTEAPGLGEPKEPKGKHKSSGYGDLKENIIPEIEVDEAMDQGPVSIKGKTGPTGGTQKIPRALFLDKEVISTINDAQPGSIKLISKPGDKRVYMYVSSFVKNALDELERGRSSREKLKKQSKLADVLADKLPSAIRGKIKKEINPKMDSGLKMHYVDLNISPKKDKTGYWVLAKGESAPLVAEEQNKKITISGTEKAISMLKSELKNNSVKFETDGNKVIVDNSPKTRMAVKMVKERVGMQSIKLNENLVEQKLRSLIRNIIKEELSENINWDNISSEDASKLFDYHERTGMLPTGLSAEKYDEIMKKYGISRQDGSDIPFQGMTEESKYEDTMPKYRLGALKKLLDISIKDGSSQDVITHLQNAIQSLEKQAKK